MQFLSGQFSPRVAYFLVFISSTVWGLLWIPLRMVADYGVSPIWVNTLFMGVPALTLAMFGWRTLWASRRSWIRIVAISIFMGSGFVLYSLGLINASVSKTTVLFYLTPIWATIFGLFVLGETSTWQRWGAIALALVGCLLVMRLNPLAISFERSDLYGFGSGLCWGLGSVLLRRFSDIHYVAVTFGQYVVGATLASLAAILLGVPVPDVSAIVAALPITIFAAAGIFLPTVLIIFRISQYVSPGLVGILMLSEVVFAVASSWLLLGENLNHWQWIGVVAILATGVWLGLAADENTTQSNIQEAS